MAKAETVKLTRVTEAIEIPYGTKVMVPAGTEVTITQALGDTYTVKTAEGYLVRIADRDADALGKQPGALAAAAARAAVAPAGGETVDAEELSAKVWAELATIFDPEIPVNVVDLGLIYECRVLPVADGRYRVEVVMTLTAPGCGMGDVLKEDAAAKIHALPGVAEAEVEMVFDPPWDPSRMSDAARLALNMF
jgi:probable FeS assembly SUF system protein SufT